MKEKMILSDGGNLLRYCELGWYFSKPNGEFIRQVSNGEGDWLSRYGHEIDFHFPQPHPQFFPKWEFIASVRVTDDFSNFRAETSCNGGNYSFATFEDWFVAKFSNGDWKFMSVTRHSTSAEFSYDELFGSFQTDLGTVNISNSSELVSYLSQSGKSWNEETESYHYEIEEVLEKFGEYREFPELWTSQYNYFPSKWDEDDRKFDHPALKFSDKKEILIKLKELGCDLRQGYYRSRNRRKGFVKSGRR
jgi:hypothetical protein